MALRFHRIAKAIFEQDTPAGNTKVYILEHDPETFTVTRSYGVKGRKLKSMVDAFAGPESSRRYAEDYAAKLWRRGYSQTESWDYNGQKD